MNRLLRIAAVLLPVLLIGGTAGLARAAYVTPEVRTQVAASRGHDTVPVIVRFADRVDTAPFGRRSDHRAARAEMLRALKDRAAADQRPLQMYLRGRGLKTTELWIVNALAVDLPADLVEPLAAWPGVETIELDGTVPPPSPVPLVVPAAPATWNIDATGAPTLWSEGFTGAGVTVALLDTGVNPDHPALTGTYRNLGGDWFNPYNPASTAPEDYLDNGLAHGTAVTSVVLGGTLTASGFPSQTLGMAPGARWIAARIFIDPTPSSTDTNPNNRTTNSAILLAMGWALDPDGNGVPDDAPEIVNNSWGFENGPNQCLTTFRDATLALQNAGIHVIYAAGNTGPNAASSVSPANNDVGFGVGSVNPDLVVSRFSARGPSPCATSIYTPIGASDIFPELQAPGEDLRVANGTTSLGGAALVAGTSFSTPHVSGALALLREAIPRGAQSNTAYRLELETALLKTADDLGTPGPDNTYGYGLLNVDAAYLRLSGQPSLSLYTPGSPENDTLVDFGNIPPATRVELDMVLRNVGGATLNLSAIDLSGIAPPFETVADTCPAALVPDASCSVTLAFTPESFGSFSDLLTITSDDPRTPVLNVTLQGIGNSPPAPAVLLSPSDGATLAGTSVLLTWFQEADPDGDPLTQTLFYADNDLFFPSFPPIVVALNAPVSGVLLAGSGLLLGLALLRRRSRPLLFLLLAGLLGLSASCGGSAGGSGLPAANQSYSLSGLPPGTTYYWKIQTDDGQGGAVESPIRSFTLR